MIKGMKLLFWHTDELIRTDEAKFIKDGMYNCRNSHSWSDKNREKQFEGFN